MGTFSMPVEIAGPDNERFKTVDALVDTGSTYTMLPASLLTALGVSPIARRSLRLANGQRIYRDVGEARVRLNGEVQGTPAIFGNEDSHSILGAVTLEQFGLAVDPVDERLVPTDAIGLRA